MPPFLLANTNNQTSLKLMSIPEVEFYFNLILTVNFTLCSLILPFLIYIILRHSKNMNRYKYFLVNVVIWMFLLEFGAFFLKPRFLAPRYCMAFKTLFPMSKQVVWLLANCALFILMNMETGLLGLIVYRFFKAFPGRLSKGELLELLVFGKQ